MKKRIFSLLMALMMALSLVPVSVFAEDTDTVSCGSYPITVAAGETRCFAFTPEADGCYEFYSTGEADTYGVLYDDNWGYDLDWNDNRMDDRNFGFACELTAGETYTLKVNTCSDEDESFTVVIGRHKTHVESENWTYDNWNHWRYCVLCGQRMSEEQPHTYAGDFCECGAINPNHTHNTDGIGYSETRHWPNCTICYKQMGPAQEHTFDENGVCTVCGCTDYTDHEHDTWGEMGQNEWGHWQRCSVCGSQTTETEEHNYDGGNYCTVCGWLNPNHTHVSCEYINADRYDEETGEITEVGHYQICEICGERMGDPLPHVYEDGYCVCGAADPKHDCVVARWYDWNDDMHWRVCEICGRRIGKPVPHTYVDGRCECGIIDPNHEHEFGNWVASFGYSEELGMEADLGHYQVCRICNRQMSEIEDHVYDGNYCEKCGAVNPEHEHVFDYWITAWNYDEDTDEETDVGHIARCAICECTYGDIGSHTYEYGRCTVCGAASAEHTHSYIYRDFGPCHGLVCTLCQDVESYEDHTYGSNGICTVCGHAKKGAAPTAISIRNGENKELIITPTYSDGTSQDMTVQNVDFRKGDGSPDGWVYEAGSIYTDAGVLGSQYYFARHEDGRFCVNYGLFNGAEEIDSNVLDNCEWYTVYQAAQNENIADFTLSYGNGVWTAVGKTYDGLDVTMTLDGDGNVLTYTIAGEQPAMCDVDGDGDIDGDDLTVLLRHVSKIECIEDEALLATLDFDGSGYVDAGDVTVFAQALEN